MTEERLTRHEVAMLAGLTPGTFSVYLHDARERADAGLPALPKHPPVPDGHLGRTPYWLPATVDAWLTRRAAARNATAEEGTT